MTEVKCETCQQPIWQAAIGDWYHKDPTHHAVPAPPLTADVQEGGYTLRCSECPESFASGATSQVLRSHKDTHVTSCSFKVVWS